MAQKIDPETLTREQLLIAYDSMRSKLVQIGFRHRAALEFLKEMEISEEFSDWVSMKARQLGI